MLLPLMLQSHINGDVESTKDSGAVRWTHGLERQPSSLQASPGMTITIFSINCDTMKRARAGLGSHGAARNFHDHKTAGIARQVRFRLADASA
jgi:hypothetical protein